MGGLSGEECVLTLVLGFQRMFIYAKVNLDVDRLNWILGFNRQLGDSTIYL